MASFFRRKKKDKVKEEGKIVSFENTAFFAAQAQAAAEAAREGDEPLYFDQMSTEQQKAWLDAHTVRTETGEGATGDEDEDEENKNKNTAPLAGHVPDPSESTVPLRSSSLGIAAASAGLAEGANAHLETVGVDFSATQKAASSSSDGTASLSTAVSDGGINAKEVDSEDTGPRTISMSKPIGWRPSPAGSQLVMDISSIKVDLTHDPQRVVTLNAEPKKKGLLGLLSRKHDQRAPIVPPVAPNAPPHMDFRASDLRMTDAERIQVMEMVKQKKWTVSSWF